jgi:hypothetical protein
MSRWLDEAIHAAWGTLVGVDLYSMEIGNKRGVLCRTLLSSMITRA